MTLAGEQRRTEEHRSAIAANSVAGTRRTLVPLMRTSPELYESKTFMLRMFEVRAEIHIGWRGHLVHVILRVNKRRARKGKNELLLVAIARSSSATIRVRRVCSERLRNKNTCSLTCINAKYICLLYIWGVTNVAWPILRPIVPIRVRFAWGIFGESLFETPSIVSRSWCFNKNKYVRINIKTSSWVLAEPVYIGGWKHYQ